MRQLAAADYQQYDLLLVMDAANLVVMRRQCPAKLQSRLGLFLVVAGVQTGGEVPDPYLGDLGDFREVRALVEYGVDGLVRRMG